MSFNVLEAQAAPLYYIFGKNGPHTPYASPSATEYEQEG